MAPKDLVLNDDWSDLAAVRRPPEIDRARMHAYRTGRLRAEMAKQDAALLILSSPVSLRYAIDYRSYGLYQSHKPTTYLFFPADGPLVLHGAYGQDEYCDAVRPGRALNHMDGGPELAEQARLLADDVVRFFSEIGSTNRRVAIEDVPSAVTQALMQRGIEVLEGGTMSEMARVVKSEDELACIRWSVAVAEHGVAKMHAAIRPGVTELQLWGILNYANLANNGDWHDGRMLASGPRTNPWLQEASQRKIEAGDLVGFDTDMVGPGGYFTDLSRTVFCGPGRPTRRQKELYRYAYDEVAHNTALIRPGLTFAEFQARAWPVPEEFHAQAYTCVIHACGMVDEYPRINPRFRGPTPYDGVIEEGMVLCVESYIGAVGERDGVKLEQQVLVTADGTEPLSTYPWDEQLLD